jgi:8-hydroxy-5-deazaflavin:NADPH oxidoreductase
MTDLDLKISVLGGTGPQGRGLAYRFAVAGHDVVVGSRDGARARTIADELRDRSGGKVGGEANVEAARAGDVVIVAVPWQGHRDLLTALADDLAGKVVVDCVNPIGFDERGAFPLVVEDGSAAQQAAALLPASRVVAAFHHVSAVLLEDPTAEQVDSDVLVLGDDREATDLVIGLADRIPGLRGVYAGRLRNSGQVEAFAANLISINRRYKAHAGLRITDV